MAKDGTNRGGRRVRAGDKPMSVAEKLQKGQAVRLMENDIPVLTSAELEAVDLPEGAVVEGADMPKPADYLSAKQKNGVPLGADEIYKETWLWLKERGCERLGKHPTTGGVISSPFVQMSQQYQKSANLIWYEIYDIVKQNCTVPFEDNPNDTMELLLRRKIK